MSYSQIKISALDNEFYLIAFNKEGTDSYEICHIQRTFSFGLELNIKHGAYQGMPNTIDGLGNGNTKVDVKIPAGDYSLVAVGINWSEPEHFRFSVDGEHRELKSKLDSNSGVVWTPNPIAITVPA